MADHPFKHVLVTGGAGYVGSRLVPQLLDAGYKVTVLDKYWYESGDHAIGKEIFGDHYNHPNLTQIHGDIRNDIDVRNALKGCDAVIHLACISNDPSFDLDPAFGKSINLDCFRPLVQASKGMGIKRFIYASSSSVYGVKEEERVTEDLPLEPMTDYSKFKADCEKILSDECKTGNMEYTILRPATVCGYAPRQRLDVVVNILTNHAYNNGVIKVDGGDQYRPNLHIDDMARAYLTVLDAPAKDVNGEIFNVGGKNHTVNEIADTVKKVVQRDRNCKEIRIEKTTAKDNRSYRVCSDKIRDRLGFTPEFDIEEAVQGLKDAMAAGKLPDSLEASRYFNMKRMKGISAFKPHVYEQGCDTGAKSFYALKQKVQEWRSTPKPDGSAPKIGISIGCFDLLHVNHIASLQEARQHCDKLIVAVNSDDSVRRSKPEKAGVRRPVNDQWKRANELAALEGIVDAVVVFDEKSPQNVIKVLKPDVLIKGGDFKSAAEIPESKFFKGEGQSVVLTAPPTTGPTTSILANALQGKKLRFGRD